MKTLFISAILLLCAGCASSGKFSYVTVTPAQLENKIQRNDTSRDFVWNHWNYAGSDEKYDYVYEYTPGCIIPYGFQCYKMPRGDLNVSFRYEFDPDYGNNKRLF